MKFQKLLAGVLSAAMVFTGLPAGGADSLVSKAADAQYFYQELLADDTWDAVADSVNSAEGTAKDALFPGEQQSGVPGIWHSNYNGQNEVIATDGELTGNNNYYIMLPQSKLLGQLSYISSRTNGTIKRLNVYVSNVNLEEGQTVSDIASDEWKKVYDGSNDEWPSHDYNADDEGNKSTATFTAPETAKYVKIEAKQTYGYDSNFEDQPNAFISAKQFILYEAVPITNIALATAETTVAAKSGETGTDNSADKAIDGNDATAWKSAAEDSENPYIILDLGANTYGNLSDAGITIKWDDNSWAKSYVIETTDNTIKTTEDGKLAANDASQWREVISVEQQESVTDSKNQHAKSTLTVSDLRRYVRLTIKELNEAASGQVGIKEIEIYGMKEKDSDEKAALHNLIDEAQDILDAGNGNTEAGEKPVYTEATWKQLEAALKDAQKVLANSYATDDEYRAAETSLKTAMEGLITYDSYPRIVEGAIDRDVLAQNAFASSEQNPPISSDGTASYAFNGNPSNWWHTRWSGEKTENETTDMETIPAYIGSSFDKAYKVKEVTYTGRTIGVYNWIGTYVLFLATHQSDDGEPMYPTSAELLSEEVQNGNLSALEAKGKVISGRFELSNDHDPSQSVLITVDGEDSEPVTAFGFILLALTDNNGEKGSGKNITASEINVIATDALSLPRTEISDAAVKLTGPKADASPKAAATEDAGYTVTETKWYKKQEETAMADTDKFDGTSSYKAVVTLTAKSEYRFLDGSKPKSILTGNKASYEVALDTDNSDQVEISEDQKTMTITHIFDPAKAATAEETASAKSDLENALKDKPTENTDNKYATASWNAYKSALDTVNNIKTDIDSGEYIPETAKEKEIKDAIGALTSTFQALKLKLDAPALSVAEPSYDAVWAAPTAPAGVNYDITYATWSKVSGDVKTAMQTGETYKAGTYELLIALTAKEGYAFEDVPQTITFTSGENRTETPVAATVSDNGAVMSISCSYTVPEPCTCEIDTITFDGRTIYIPADKQEVEYILKATASVSGDCYYTDHRASYSFKITGGDEGVAEISADANGNYVLKVKRAGSVEVTVTVTSGDASATKAATFTLLNDEAATADDKNNLNSKITEAKEYKEEEYTPKSWQALQDAIAQAEEMTGDANATKGSVASVMDTLADAINSLERKSVSDLSSEFAALKDEFSRYEQQKDTYTAESWDALEKAQSAAQNLYDKLQSGAITEEQFVKQFPSLLSALRKEENSLASKAKQNLQAALNGAKALYDGGQKSSYPADKWNAFKAAYENAKAALESGTEEQRNNALAKLTTAKKDLEDAINSAQATKPEAPTIKSAKAVAKKNGVFVQIVVNKVPNAANYEIYRVVGGKKTLAGTTASGTLLDSKATKATTKYYAVAIAADGKTKSADGTLKAAVIGTAAKKVKAKKVSGRIKVTWKKVKKAKKYFIYRSNKKNGKYTKVGTSKKNSFIDKKAKSGKKYCYKIAVKANGKISLLGKATNVVKK